MAYNKTTWIDDITPLDAEHLNNIEDGIEKMHISVEEAVAEAVAEAKDYTDTKIGDIDTALDSIIVLQNSYIGENEPW